MPQKLPSASALAGYAFRLDPGADLRRDLVARVSELRLPAAAIVSCVGSLRAACLRLADASLPEPFAGPFEIVSVTGTLGNGRCHLHMSIADAAGRVSGGHMREGCIIHTTAEIVLMALPDLTFRRSPDAATGFDELIVA